MNCVECTTTLQGRQIKFCSRECKERYARRCYTPSQSDWSGPSSPRWKGGCRYWSKGRWGKDKNGLSWKTQRRLAWERDDFTCQHCGERKSRKPDVHHINPWMNSHSHALDNLICLCQSCHLKEEAKVQEVWGGVAASDPRCSCGGRSRLRSGLCYNCAFTLIQQGRESELRLTAPGVKHLAGRLRKLGYALPAKGRGVRKRSTSETVRSPKPPRKGICPVCGGFFPRPLKRGCPHCLLPWILVQRETRTIRDIAAELGVTNPTIIHWCSRTK